MTQKFAYYSFSYLIQAINSLKEDLDLKNVKLSERVAILTLIAFSYESFLNHTGHKVFKSWGDHMKKKLSPEGKLALLCEVGRHPIDYGTSPFQSFKEIMQLRNKLAHAETEYLDYDPTKHHRPESWPKPAWIKNSEAIDIERAITDLHSIINSVQVALKISPVPNFLLMEMVNFQP